MKPFNPTGASLQTLPERVGLLDTVFRGLAIAGAPEIVALTVNLATHPDGPGIVGQGFFFRLGLGLLVMPVMLVAGALIVWRAPGNVVGRFLILIALGGIAAQFAWEAAGSGLFAWALVLLILYGAGVVIPSVGYLMFTFPTGQVYPPRLTRVVILVAVVKFIGVGLEIMASPGQIKIFTPTVNPLFVPALAPYREVVAATIGISGLLLPTIWLAGLVSLVVRYRASPARDRRQIKWVLWALAILMPAMLFMATGVLTGYVVAGWAIPLASGVGAVALAFFLVAITVAIVRYRLFEIDLILNRALVYGVLTAGVVGVYALIVGVAGELFHQSGSLIVSLLATGLIAVLFQPVRDRLQRAINRLMYGDRDDPYVVLSRLGQRLETALAPEAILPTLVETIAQTLKLPYVAITLKHTNGVEPTIAAAFGTPTDSAVRLPLTYQLEYVGELLIATRALNEAFTQSEQRLLADIAHQAGVAAHAVRLSADLQRSRERLVTAREEERRRLRRDLHDGLGPKLAGQTLKLEAARDALDEKPLFSRALLDELVAESQTLVAEIRRLVYALRPPVLDELGLVAAVRQQAAGSELNGLRVTVTAPPVLPPLPAAVEAAAYRIVQESLTNVVRHAHAQRCWVQLALTDSDLRVEVADDGVGLLAERHAGVGLASMRERAEEIGGSCVIEARDDGGVCVTVTLPLLKG